MLSGYSFACDTILSLELSLFPHFLKFVNGKYLLQLPTCIIMVKKYLLLGQMRLLVEGGLLFLVKVVSKATVCRWFA